MITANKISLGLAILLFIFFLISTFFMVEKANRLPADVCYTKFAPEIKKQGDLNYKVFTGQQTCLITNCLYESGKNISAGQIKTLASCKIAGIIN